MFYYCFIALYLGLSVYLVTRVNKKRVGLSEIVISLFLIGSVLGLAAYKKDITAVLHLKYILPVVVVVALLTLQRRVSKLGSFDGTSKGIATMAGLCGIASLMSFFM